MTVISFMHSEYLANLNNLWSASSIKNRPVIEKVMKKLN